MNPNFQGSDAADPSIIAESRKRNVSREDPAPMPPQALLDAFAVRGVVRDMFHLRPKPNHLLCCAVAGLAVGLHRDAAHAADWTQYRGPNQDGSSPEPMRTDWNARPPRIVWQRTIDPAWSSITTRGNRLFTQGNRRIGSEDREVCIALDADTGAEVWSANLGVADYPDAGTGSLDGPRSTPTVQGDRVYVLTSYLDLQCLDAASGRLLWRRNFPEEFPGTRVIAWQNAASPLLVGDRIFLNSNVGSGSLTAIRASDGVTLWNRETDRMTHATPT